MDIENGSLKWALIEPMKPIKLFYCYAREDKRFRNMLERYLSTMKRSSWVSSWHDGMINAGDDWKQKIDEQIRAADVILLLISPDFMSSDYCYGVEMKRALERHEAKEACVIPIILRPTDWEDAPFYNLQVLPTNGKPLTRWQDRDEAFLDIARGIRKSVKQLLLSQRTQEQWMDEGTRCLHLGRPKEALAAFDHAIEQAPYDLKAYLGKVTALRHLNRYEEAIEVCQQAMSIVPKNILSYIEDDTLSYVGNDIAIATIAVLYEYKGITFQDLNRFEESLIAYDRAIRLIEHGGFYYRKGLALLKLQRYEEALSAFEQAICLNPNDKNTFVYYIEKGAALLDLGRYEEALEACERALTLNPDCGHAHFSKGVLLRKLDRIEEALVAYEQAIQLDPHSTDAYLGKGECLYHLKDYEASLAVFQKAVDLDPNDSNSLCGVGNSLFSLHRNKEALVAFDAAIHLDPHNRYAYLRLADTLQDLGRDLESQVVSERFLADYDDEEKDSFLSIDDPERLLAFCEQKIQDDPQNVTALQLKLVALFKLKQNKEAHLLYIYLLQNYPDLERGVKGPVFKLLRSQIEQSLRDQNNSVTE